MVREKWYVEFWPGICDGAGAEGVDCSLCLLQAVVKCLEDASMKFKPKNCLAQVLGRGV
jgi:hypothetical protein